MFTPTHEVTELAIYSCNLRSIGRTTHEAGTAGAHLRYISRPSEKPICIAEHMPVDGNDARAWMDAQEKADRKNARVIDKIRIALPRELTSEQRVEVVRSFMEDVTKGNQVPWYAGFHDMGEDAHNPHVHIVVRDRSIHNGKRLIGLSDSKRDWIKKGNEGESPTEFVRKKWEDHANAALEKHGIDEKIDRRSLKDQGVDRVPQIHEGVQAQKIDSMVQRPRSKPRTTGNGRIIDYPQIDKGKTRIERNAEIIDLNLERASRSEHFETRYRALYEKEQAVEDRKLSAWIAQRTRSRTKETRDIKRNYAGKARIARQSRDAALKTVNDMLKSFHHQQLAALKDSHDEANAALQEKHSKITSRLYSIFDLTGKTRRARKAEKDDLRAAQVEERRQMVSDYQKIKTTRTEAVFDEYGTELDAIEVKKVDTLRSLSSAHEFEINEEQERLQAREAERETHRQAVELAIAAHKRETQARTGAIGRDGIFGDSINQPRSSNRKPRVPGAKAERMRKAAARKEAITRAKDTIRDDFDGSDRPSANDSKPSFEERLEQRLEQERQLRQKNRDRNDPDYR